MAVVNAGGYTHNLVFIVHTFYTQIIGVRCVHDLHRWSILRRLFRLLISFVLLSLLQSNGIIDDATRSTSAKVNCNDIVPTIFSISRNRRPKM